MRVDGRRVYLRHAHLDDYSEWASLRLASKSILEAVEPEWTDAHLTRQAYEERIGFEAQAIAQGTGYPFLIFRHHDGALVGGLTLGPIVERIALLGIWVGKPFVGRGYAVHAVRAAMTFGWNNLGLTRIDATVLPDNLASIRVLESVGFDAYDRTVTFMVSGEHRRHTVYAAMRP